MTGHAYLPWISFLLTLLLDLQSMAEKKWGGGDKFRVDAHYDSLLQQLEMEVLTFQDVECI